MVSLSITPVGPATLSVLSAPRPLPSPTVQDGQKQGPAALSVQALAQDLFQRTLQATTLFPVAQPAVGSTGLMQDATASLLASLNAPQATANATPTANATTNAAVAQVPDTAPSASPSPSPATLGDIPATQDAFATSLNPDFAMQTALRFGAGVAALATPSLSAAVQGDGLVRDAASVQRLGNLQPRAGSPGPEAFAQSQAAIYRVLRSYDAVTAVPTAQSTSQVDLFA